MDRKKIRWYLTLLGYERWPADPRFLGPSRVVGCRPYPLIRYKWLLRSESGQNFVNARLSMQEWHNRIGDRRHPFYPINVPEAGRGKNTRRWLQPNAG